MLVTHQHVSGLNFRGIMVTKQKQALQYIDIMSSTLLFLDHRRGRHAVHDQLPPRGDGEHPSETHQDTGVLDSTADRDRLCNTKVGVTT